MPIKCIGRLNHITPNPYPTFGTVHVATSHFFQHIIATAFAVPPGKVVVCGLPRCDALRPEADRGTGRDAIRHLLGIPNGRKLVLWMPTYRTEDKSRASGAKIRTFLDDLPPWALQSLDQACEAHGCTVVVKLHSFDLLNAATAPPGHRNIRWLRAEDWLKHQVQLYDLIAASDALLSDVSSVLIDYLVTDRPIGIIGFDVATYTRDLIFPIEYLLQSQRFHVLSASSDVAAFAEKVSSGAAVGVPPNDIAQILYQRSAELGAECILKHVGL